jgi:SAM-dependent methyltransferase
MTTVAFEARRFQSTAAYYLRYRIPYPDTLIARVANRCGFQIGDALLDLGCGPGQLGIAFAKLGARVTAMDPEPEMLAAATQGARAAGVDIAVRPGSSYDLGPDIGALKLAVMGRSFHWMDRPATLAALDELIVPGGAVVLFHDRNVAMTPAWRAIILSLAEKFSPERSAERQKRRSDAYEPHESVLLHSAFNCLERIGIVHERHLDLDDLIGRAFSMSVTSPQALGDKVADFEAELRQQLMAAAPDGHFTEIVESTALLAFRA